ncbi:MAG: hypothetical protein R3E95_21570 [Thiolinea sp.]
MQTMEHELAGLRINFQNAREDAHELRTRLKDSEIQKNRALQLLKATSGHENFKKARRQLESARLYIQKLTAELHRREQRIAELQDSIHVLRKHLRRRGTRPAVPSIQNIRRLPLPRSFSQQGDNLQKINGIDAHIERKLRSLGIISYRQLAEISAQQQTTIQRLIGEGNILPIRQWAREAGQWLDQSLDNTHPYSAAETEVPVERISKKPSSRSA